MAVAHVRSDTLTGDPYTTLLDSTDPESTALESGFARSNMVHQVRFEKPYRIASYRAVDSAERRWDVLLGFVARTQSPGTRNSLLEAHSPDETRPLGEGSHALDGVMRVEGNF